MKILIDFLMVIVFFVAYKSTGDMIFAVKVAIAAAVLQLVIMRVAKIAIQPIHWFGFVSVVVFGGLGVFFNDPKFFQWKFSIIEWLMGMAIIGGQLVFNKNVLKVFLGNELELPNQVWKTMAWMWGGFFIALGAINWWVFTNFNYEIWVDFKTFWAFGLTVVFMLVQGLWLSKFLGDKN